jgi:hypothetical protein
VDEHERDHADEHQEEPDMSEWLATANTTTCPVCDAPGALTLGGGIFCPTCGKVTPDTALRRSRALLSDRGP